LVEAGRAGDDVVVMDSKPKERDMRLSSYAAFVAGSTHAYLLPKMAQDQKPPDLKKMLLGTTAKNWTAKRPEFEAAVARAIKGRIAQDAEVHIHEHLDGAGAEAPDDLAPGDPNGAAGAVPGQEDDDDQAHAAKSIVTNDDDLAAKVQQLLQGQIDDNDLAIILHALKEVKAPDLDAPDPAAAPPKAGNGDEEPDDKRPLAAADEDDVIDKPDTARMESPAMDKRPVTRVAMDAAIQKAVGDAIKKTTARLNARDEAQRFVRPWVGDLAVAMDSAADVYKFALEQTGEDVTDIHPSAYRALLSKIPKPGEEQHRAAPIAMDKATSNAYLERFPNANRLRAH
jgi:hypothetical protein